MGKEGAWQDTRGKKGEESQRRTESGNVYQKGRENLSNNWGGSTRELGGGEAAGDGKEWLRRHLC